MFELFESVFEGNVAGATKELAKITSANDLIFKLNQKYRDPNVFGREGFSLAPPGTEQTITILQLVAACGNIGIIEQFLLRMSGLKLTADQVYQLFYDENVLFNLIYKTADSLSKLVKGDLRAACKAVAQLFTAVQMTKAQVQSLLLKKEDLRQRTALSAAVTSYSGDVEAVEELLKLVPVDSLPEETLVALSEQARKCYNRSIEAKLLELLGKPPYVPLSVIMTPEILRGLAEQAKRCEELELTTTDCNQVFVFQYERLPSLVEYDRTLPILWAIDNNEPELVRALVALGAELDVSIVRYRYSRPSPNLLTPVICALDKGNAKMLECLLDLGATLDPSEEATESALYDATRQQNLAMCKLLVERAGFDVNKPYVGKKTVLHYATSPELIEYFVAQRVNINSVDSGRSTPLIYACKEGQPQQVEALIKAGANIGYRHAADSETALERAVELGHIECARLLVAAGATADPTDEFFIEALLKATQECNVELVRVLAEGLKLDVDKVPSGWGESTALMCAVINYCEDKLIERLEIARILLNAGANVSHQRRDGSSALTMAQEPERSDFKDMFEAALDAQRQGEVYRNSVSYTLWFERGSDTASRMAFNQQWGLVPIQPRFGG